MGEEKKHPQKAIPEAVQTMIVDTLGGSGSGVLGQGICSHTLWTDGLLCRVFGV